MQYCNHCSTAQEATCKPPPPPMSTDPVKLRRHTTTVLRSATLSRLLLVTLTILWRSFLSPYDTSASINPNCLSSTTTTTTVAFPRIAAAIENGVVWDGVYFVRIAECGYEYEQNYAFLPLLPLCLRLLSRTVFSPLIPLVGHRAVLALSGYVLNNVAFVFAALYLYRLSVIILKDSEAAFRASLLFCFNPASIFYTSIYSESLYALLSFGGLYHLMSGADNFGTLWLAFSGSARSNGVLNAGYIGFKTMHQAYDAIFLKKQFFLAVKVLTAGLLRCICIFIPFAAFQAYGYYNLCLEYLSDNRRPWCKARLPLLYNFIQSHYWNVGFLRYFQLKQLPNFLLALPILSISVCSIIHYVKQWPDVFLSLGFRSSHTNNESISTLFSLESEMKSERVLLWETGSSSTDKENCTLRHRKQSVKEEKPISHSRGNNLLLNKFEFMPITALPFILHLGFMTATAFFVMHVQVATRFLSASPPIYWFASYLLVSPRFSKKWGYLICGYSAAYILLGSLLFSNFYPFT